MKIIIIGGGEVGVQLAKQLISEQNDVVIVEKDEACASDIANKLDCLVINEPANRMATLLKAGVETADYLISVTNSDEVNLICCGLAATHPPFKIARVRNLDYESTQMLKANMKSVDLVVNPEVEASRKIIRSVEHGAISDIIAFSSIDMHMRNLVVDEDSVFTGKTVEEACKAISQEFLIAGIVRRHRFIIPGGGTVIEEEDNLYLLATSDALDEIYDSIGKSRDHIENILIVGGGVVGRHVAEHFTQRQNGNGGPFRELAALFNGKGKKDIRRIKIVDRDYERCKQLAEHFPSSMVINADISDETIFEEERMSGFDVIVTTTDSHELNVLSALYAKKLGIRRAVSVVSNINYINIAFRLGIDVVVSPKNSIIDPILKHIRTGKVSAIHSIADTDVDIMEARVQKESSMCGKQLKDIKLPADTLVLSANRDGASAIPHGNFVFEKGDDLIVLARASSASRVDSLISGE